MKKLINYILIVLIAFSVSSCETVDPGHKGVEVSWGGKTNMDRVYPEGIDWGVHWLWDDLINYDVRQQTTVKDFEFNDKNNMLTGVEIALDYYLEPDHVNNIHANINGVELKIFKTLKSAGKEVIPQYTASELNLHKRVEAEQKLKEILSVELPEIFVGFARVQLTDVDIPEAIAQTAELTAKQLELNKLSFERAQEAENNFKAAEWDAKTKAILSKPEMLELQRVMNDKIKWEGFVKHGISPYGTGNVFGVNTPVLKEIR